MLQDLAMEDKHGFMSIRSAKRVAVTICYVETELWLKLQRHSAALYKSEVFLYQSCQCKRLLWTTLYALKFSSM